MVEFDGPTAITLSRGVGSDCVKLALIFVGGLEMVWVMFLSIHWRSLILEIAHIRGVTCNWVVVLGRKVKGLDGGAHARCWSAA